MRKFLAAVVTAAALLVPAAAAAPAQGYVHAAACQQWLNGNPSDNDVINFALAHGYVWGWDWGPITFAFHKGNDQVAVEVVYHGASPSQAWIPFGYCKGTDDDHLSHDDVSFTDPSWW